MKLVKLTELFNCHFRRSAKGGVRNPADFFSLSKKNETGSSRFGLRKL